MSDRYVYVHFSELYRKRGIPDESMETPAFHASRKPDLTRYLIFGHLYGNKFRIEYDFVYFQFSMHYDTIKVWKER